MKPEFVEEGYSACDVSSEQVWVENPQRGRLEKEREERLELTRLEAQIKIAEPNARAITSNNSSTIHVMNIMGCNMSKYLQPFIEESNF